MSAKDKAAGGEAGLQECRGEALNPCWGVDHKLTYLETTVRGAGPEIK